MTTFDDVLKYLPNVTFSSNGPGQGNIYMRGLSAGFAGNQSSAAINPFPNVATYLDDQSMAFPARNVDVYMADMERIEVLEGPQGTLFGGGAEAGAIRYITNKPKLNVTEGNAEASYGTTAHGDPNTAITAVLNVPLIADTLAVRAVIYNDRRGGYIDNVPSQFTRFPTDPGTISYHLPYPANAATANNYSLAARAQNPVTYQGVRASALWQINTDWNLLIQQSYQNMDAEGIDAQFPLSSQETPLGAWQETSFTPSYDKDKWENTSWTVNGKIGDLKLVYTGGYLDRTIDNAMDYTNYARSAGGFYYTCGGGAAPMGKGVGPLTCYSPVSSWHGPRRNHPSEPRAAAQHARRLAAAGPHRRVLGGLRHQGRHELPVQVDPVLYSGEPPALPGGHPGLHRQRDSGSRVRGDRSEPSATTMSRSARISSAATSRRRSSPRSTST